MNRFSFNCFPFRKNTSGNIFERQKSNVRENNKPTNKRRKSKIGLEKAMAAKEKKNTKQKAQIDLDQPTVVRRVWDHFYGFPHSRLSNHVSISRHKTIPFHMLFYQYLFFFFLFCFGVIFSPFLRLLKKIYTKIYSILNQSNLEGVNKRFIFFFSDVVYTIRFRCFFLRL